MSITETQSSQHGIIDLYPEGRANMQRDMELIRDILDQTERRTERDPKLFKMAGDELTVGQHVDLLFHSGYLVGVPVPATNKTYTQVLVQDLTWEGHEFLAVLKNENGWAKLKKALSPGEIASMPLKVVQGVATAILEQYVKQKLGL